MAIESRLTKTGGRAGVIYVSCDVCGMVFPEHQTIRYRGRDYGIPCGDSRDIADLIRGRMRIGRRVTTAGGEQSQGDVEVAGRLVGETFYMMGNRIDPSAEFPAICLTRSGSDTIVDSAQVPDLVNFLREQRLIYEEDEANEVRELTGTVTGSTISFGFEVNFVAYLFMLDAYQQVVGTFTDFMTVDIAGTTYDITALSQVPATITVAGTPPEGVQTAIIYPYRRAGSTTTARLKSMRDRAIIGAGALGGEAGILRNDGSLPIQGDLVGVMIEDTAESAELPFQLVGGTTAYGLAAGSDVTLNRRTLRFRNSTQINVDTYVHAPDMPMHQYIWAGRYLTGG